MTGLALAARLLLDPWLGEREAFSIFLLGAAVSAWTAGAGPAAVSLTAGYFVADWFFIEPRHALSFLQPRTEVVVGFITYVASGALVLLVVGRATSIAQALRESNARFESFAGAAEDVLWIQDVDRERMLYVSPAYERIWQRPREPLAMGLAEWRASVHPQDLDRVAGAARRARERGFDEVEYRIVRPDGSMRWIRDRGFPIDDRGTIAGIATDVTVAREAEARVRWSEERLRAIFEGTAVGVALVCLGSA